MIPKAVIFDLGKVLVDFDYSIAARKIAARSRITAQEAQEALDHSPLLFDYETGRVTRKQFYDAVCAETGFQGTIEEFSSYFADIFTPIPPMVEMHASLRNAGIPVFIFSNTNDLAVDHIQRNFPFFSNFDGYIYSFEHGVMKPRSGLYEVVERMTGLNGGDLIYIDDRAENIATGRERGWQVILQETPEKTIAAVRRAGLLLQ
jgi:HAD superfamily hydrolase (TIGR01509 family)